MTVSSVFFETVLAIATGVSVVWLWRAGLRACAFGLSFVGLAAALGALLFAGFTAVDASHALITQWAAVAGFPVFGAFALWRRFRGEPAWPAAMLVVVILVLIGRWMSSPGYTMAIGSVGLAALLLVAFTRIKSAPRFSAIVIASCVFTALAGLLIGTEGQWGPLPRVDWYHLALTAANLGFGWALARTGALARAV
jgi:hypothetical protein